MTTSFAAAELPMPARADEPLSATVYYNIIPVHQPDPAKPLCLSISEGSFEELAGVVLSEQLHDGQSHFRLDGGARGGIQLRSRNSGKTILPMNEEIRQLTLLEEESFLADLEFVEAGQHRYRLCSKINPKVQARIEGGGAVRAGAELVMTDGAPSDLLFYMAPATEYHWLDRGDAPARAYQDATEMALRSIMGGLLAFGGDKISELTEIPGGSMILGEVLSLIWPEKSLDAILQEFRKDLIEDMRRLMATEAMITATNNLLNTRRAYAMEYRDTKRMSIDVSDLKESALRYAGDFGKSILALLPGIINADGKIVIPIKEEYTPLVKAGLAVYLQGALDHIMALQERALIGAFNPGNVIRFYPKAQGRYLMAGSDDKVKLGQAARERTQAISLVMIAEGTLAHGDQVAFKTGKGQYFSAWTGAMGPVTAIRKTRGEWETFRIERREGPGRIRAGDSVVLVGCKGFCISPDLDGSGRLVVMGPRDGREETMTILKTTGTGDIRGGDTIGLRLYNDKYVTADEGGGNLVRGTSPHLSGWETFTIERVTVGNTLRYGSQVVLRRPTDGRFASISAPDDSRLMMKNGDVTQSSVFTVTGGRPVGEEVASGAVFSLTGWDKRQVSINTAGELLMQDVGTAFDADIFPGEKSMANAGAEPSDWVKSYAETYTYNAQNMFMHILLKRMDCMTWRRDEVAKVKGYVVLMHENELHRVLYRGMESGPQDFKATEKRLDAIKSQYQRHLAINEVMVRYYPIHAVGDLSQASDATFAMCERLRKDTAFSTEFWRQSVLPDRAEWKLD